MNFLSRAKHRSKQQAGDTIVEVLICIAVVGLALAGGYALSNHSLQTGLDSSQRSAALLTANGQVEFLKNAQANANNGNSSFLTDYTSNPGQSFCINPTNGSRVSTTNSACSANNVLMSITYDACTGIFIVNPRWTSFRGNQQSQATLYYKLPDNFFSGPRC